MSCPPSPGRTPTARATSATWPVSACPPTCSAATCGWRGTTCSWSPAPTSTARRSWSQPTRPGCPRRSWPTRTTGSSSRTSPRSGSAYDLYTRTTTRNHYAVAQELFPGVHDNGYFIEQTTFGAISPSTGRTLPDRYIEGTCPICGYDGARGDQCDNCGNQLDPHDLINPRSDQRRDAGVRRDPALLPRPAGAGRRAGGVARRARGHRPVAAERDPVQPEHPRGHPPARDDPRHRLGHPGAARRLAGQPDQAALRLVRRGDRLPVGVDRVGAARSRATPTPGGSGGTTRRRCPTTSWARTTSPSTPRSGRPSCSPTTARATRAASPGSTATLNLPTEVVVQRVPHHGGQEVLLLASGSSSTCATC